MSSQPPAPRLWHAGVVTADQLTSTMRDLWAAALADAGIDQDTAVLFIPPGRESATGYTAKMWLRGTPIEDPPDMEALGDRLAEANSEDGQALWRVAVWRYQAPPVFAGLLRHELEHVRQSQRHGPILQQLHDRAVNVLSEYAAGVDGSGVLYQAIPMEADANAAASQFVRSRFSAADIDPLCGDHRSLLGTTKAPQPIETLSDRMRQFIRVDGARLAQEFALASD